MNALAGVVLALLGLILWGYVAVIAFVGLVCLALLGVGLILRRFDALMGARVPSRTRGIATEYRTVMVLVSDEGRRLREFASTVPDTLTIGRN